MGSGYGVWQGLSCGPLLACHPSGSPRQPDTETRCPSWVWSSVPHVAGFDWLKSSEGFCVEFMGTACVDSSFSAVRVGVGENASAQDAFPLLCWLEGTHEVVVAPAYISDKLPRETIWDGSLLSEELLSHKLRLSGGGRAARVSASSWLSFAAPGFQGIPPFPAVRFTGINSFS